jgi:hypothetical protein
MKWLFSKGRSDGMLGSVYTVLWLTGLWSTAFSFWQLSYLNNPSAVQKYVVGTLGLSMISLQFLIYSDIHKLENQASNLYTECWINLRIERFLRALIFIALLFGVGEVGHVFLPSVKLIRVAWIKDWVENFLHSPETREFSRSLFVKGSIGAYTLLAIWNVFAFGFGFRDWPSNGQRAPRVVILCRVAAFCLVSIMSALYWLSYFQNSTLNTEFAKYILCVYFVFLAAFILLRIPKIIHVLGGK